MENACITVFEPPVEYDDTTGYRTENTSPKYVVRAVRCTFAPERSSRRRTNAEGLSEFSETVPTVLLETDATITMGMRADVTPDGGTKRTFTVARAIWDEGICGAEWILELQAIET